MFYEAIIFAVVITALSSIFLYFDLKKEEKRQREIDILKQNCSDYLDTCFNRVCLSTSPEAIELLWEEMSKSAYKYTYHIENYDKFKQIRAFIRGKYWGLLKEEILLKSPS